VATDGNGVVATTIYEIRYRTGVILDGITLASGGGITQLFYVGPPSTSGDIWFKDLPSRAWYRVPQSRILNVYDEDVVALTSIRGRDGHPIVLANDDYLKWRDGGISALSGSREEPTLDPSNEPTGDQTNAQPADGVRTETGIGAAAKRKARQNSYRERKAQEARKTVDVARG
jgi:hypothetical protein